MSVAPDVSVLKNMDKIAGHQRDQAFKSHPARLLAPDWLTLPAARASANQRDQMPVTVMSCAVTLNCRIPAVLDVHLGAYAVSAAYLRPICPVSRSYGSIYHEIIRFCTMFGQLNQFDPKSFSEFIYL